MLLFTGYVKGQIVNIPDANFKDKLISLGIDVNNDMEIQEDEASNVTYLDVSYSNIVDMTGIETFVSLTYLVCFGNQISTLNVSNSIDLQYLFCNDNQITALNISGLNNLQIVYCQSNQLTSLDANNLNSLTELNCERNQISSLNINGSTNVEILKCGSNQITNLDITGLSSLIIIDCSFNQLNSLDVSNNLNLVELNCSLNQIPNLNVNNLNNIKVLDCNSNQLTSLNLNSLIILEKLNLSYNYVTTLDISLLTNLKELEFSNNVIGTINLSGLALLEKLNCSNNPLTLINLTGLTALKSLQCDNNQLTTLNVNGLINLEYLTCAGNQLTTLNIGFLTNLKTLGCGFNLLTTLDVSPFINLESLNCIQNQITSLNLSNNNNLKFLNCSINQLTSLDVTNLTQLRSLICGNNAIPNVNFSGLTQLYELFIDSTGRTSLDVSNQPLLRTLFCNSNPINIIDVSNSLQLFEFFCGGPNLTQVFMKNGVIENYFGMTLSPNLQFVCGDENQLLQINTGIASSGSPNAVATSYCTFVPGGNYNTITGTMLFDANSNGCDVTDLSHPNIRIDINDGTNQGAAFTNTTGNYAFYTQAGSFNLTPNVENPTWFTFSPTTATIPFANNNNNVSTQNFCISANGVHSDVEIVIAPITPARPGFDAVYQIVCKNKGNQLLSGNITFTYDEDKLDFVSATAAPDTQSTGLLNWNYTDLLPFENRSYYLTLNVNSPQETPAVNIGDVLSFQATITPVIGDENAVDNLFSYDQTVVGSYDPNDITCIEGDAVPPSEIGEYLHYVINFENTGTAEAENIVVRTDIDATQFDVNSLQMLNTSHNAYIRQTGATIEFIFEGIYLDTGGHGNVLLKIKSLNNLEEGDTVAKQANIFFDYNFPIETNMANTTFQALNTPGFEIDESISVYPNPTNSIVTITSSNSIQSVQLYDVQGRLLQTQIINNPSTTVDLSQQSNGIYFVKVVSDQGIKVEKVVKN